MAGPLMSITNYSELQTAIANWLHRDDLTSKIKDFIALAESRMNGDLSAREMESRTTVTTMASNAYVSMPSDLLEIRRMALQTNPTRVLKYATPDEIQQDFGYSDVTGQPVVFSVIGTQIQLAPIPDDAYNIELSYCQRIPALSDSNTTNWLLTLYPDAYLYAALCEAQPYIVNDARVATFEQRYRTAVENINAIDWYTGSTMRVRAS